MGFWALGFKTWLSGWGNKLGISKTAIPSATPLHPANPCRDCKNITIKELAMMLLISLCFYSRFGKRGHDTKARKMPSKKYYRQPSHHKGSAELLRPTTAKAKRLQSPPRSWRCSSLSAQRNIPMLFPRSLPSQFLLVPLFSRVLWLSRLTPSLIEVVVRSTYCL